jgi:RNA polymerase sigma factor (sigma-70 family)
MVHSDEASRQQRLIGAARAGDAAARERVVAEDLDLIRAVASRYRDFGLPLEDLVQEGALGLLDAVERFDPARGVEFETFARFRIRRAIRNALTEQARLVRLPKHVVERRRALAAAESRLIAAHGTTPTPEELAAATGLSTAAVVEARAAAITPISLDALATIEGSPLGSLVADASTPDPEAAVLDEERRRAVRDAVGRLSPRQREVISRHFGLDGTEDSVAAVAEDLNLSERRTRTIQCDALHRLADELSPRTVATTDARLSGRAPAGRPSRARRARRAGSSSPTRCRTRRSP